MVVRDTGKLIGIVTKMSDSPPATRNTKSYRRLFCGMQEIKFQIRA